MFIEILFKMLLFKGGVLIYAEHCKYYLFIYRSTSLKEPNIQWDKFDNNDLQMLAH